MGFSVQTLGTLAHVQESPLDEIYVLLMIFIGPLAQSSGKLPRNLKGSCFQLVVRMQRVIKLRKGLAKAKMHLSRFSKSSQTYDCVAFAFFFFKSEVMEFCFIRVPWLEHLLNNVLKSTALFICVCNCICCMSAQGRTIANVIHSFLFPME